MNASGVRRHFQLRVKKIASYQAYSKAIIWPKKLMTGDATDVYVKISPSSYRQQLIIVRTKSDGYVL